MVTLHDPEAVGFSKARLSRIQPVMQSYIDDSKYPGLITLLARHGHVVHLECYGLMNVEAHQPMRPDALCALASMTKPISCVAALMLLEQGFFQLNDPIAMFLPAAKDLQVCVHATDADLQLVDLARAPTMRDLFTHTAGFAYWTPDDHPLAENFAALDSLHPTTLQEYVQGILALPLLHQPGTTWWYSPSLDVLAHIVEVIADMPFDEFVRRNITEPPGMADTGYVVPDQKVDRLATIYAPVDQGGHQRVGPDPADFRPPQVPYGGTGLYSTVSDYARFVQMLLNGGHLDGIRLLGRKTVELMLTNHLPAAVLPSFDVVVLSKGYYTKGYGFGLGVRVLMNPAENEILGSVGSFGWTATIWLAHILSQADHRMNQVQSWVERQLDTLRACTGQPVQLLDLTDDRLADVLRILSDDTYWTNFERGLTGRLLRVYDLRAERVRLDSTTASGYWQVTADGLFQFGHSKDRRPDLPQLKVMLATLDPLGLPLATDVLSGQRADDPLYLPAIARVRASLPQRGLLYVGDCKMGALETRAGVQAAGDFYLCPLSAVQVPPALLDQYLTEARAGGPAVPVERPQADGSVERIADGYEHSVSLTAVVNTWSHSWVERRVLVRSHAQAGTAETALRTRLAQAALSEVLVRRPGKTRVADQTSAQQVVDAILARFQVTEMLRATVTEQITEQRVRAYRNRPASVRERRTLTIAHAVDAVALEAAIARLGWRVYATNQSADQLPLAQVVLAYREEYLVERSLGRLKGQPLSLTPLYVERDDHVTGLIRLLATALRVLTLLKFVVRRRLRQEGEQLAGLYAGNPKRATARPTAERLPEAFRGITLTSIVEPHQTRRHLTTLSPLQQRILALLEFTPTIYTKLCGDSSQPP